MEIASTVYVLEEFKDEKPQRNFVLFNEGYGKRRLSLFVCLFFNRSIFRKEDT